MRIFILDDSKERLHTFSSKLIGHVVFTAMTASEAISILERESPFDHIYLDHDLGGQAMVPSGPGTGYEVAQWLSQHPEKTINCDIIIHSFNPDGAKNMASFLPTARIVPGAWLLI
jgi:CheY-like chemotaxis protein